MGLNATDRLSLYTAHALIVFEWPVVLKITNQRAWNVRLENSFTEFCSTSVRLYGFLQVRSVQSFHKSLRNIRQQIEGNRFMSWCLFTGKCFLFHGNLTSNDRCFYTLVVYNNCFGWKNFRGKETDFFVLWHLASISKSNCDFLDSLWISWFYWYYLKSIREFFSSLI